MPEAQLGTGITLVFATTTTFTPRILGVIFSTISRPVIPNHDMSSGHMDKSPGNIEDWGSVDVEYEQDQDAIETTAGVPITLPPELVTFQWPIKSGQATGAALAGQGFANNFTFPSPFEERMIGTFTVTWSQKPVHTAGV